MSYKVDLPHFILQSQELADWLDSQADSWWTVDGDPVLTSSVDFPCPTEELSAELRRIGKKLLVFDPRDASMAHGQSIPIGQLDELADRQNNSGARTFLLSWDDDDVQWLLAEFFNNGQ